jgi:alanine racemase
MNWRPTRLEVNLNSIRTNYTRIRKHVGGTRVIAVVKANAYNVGALPAAWALRSVGADFFAVATPDEALSLRDGGITDPVLVLGASPYEVAAEYVRSGIRAALTDTAMLHALAGAARQNGKPARVHLKVDTGLGRIGFRPDKALEVVDAVQSLPEVELEGILSRILSPPIRGSHGHARAIPDFCRSPENDRRKGYLHPHAALLQFRRNPRNARIRS